MSEIIEIYFRVLTPFGAGLVIGFYRELNYTFGTYQEKESPDYTFLVAMDSGGEMVLPGNNCKLEIEK